MSQARDHLINSLQCWLPLQVTSSSIEVLFGLFLLHSVGKAITSCFLEKFQTPHHLHGSAVHARVPERPAPKPDRGAVIRQSLTSCSSTAVGKSLKLPYAAYLSLPCLLMHVKNRT